MGLTWPIVFAVLCGAFLHAAWNALTKSGRDKALDTALVSAGRAIGTGVIVAGVVALRFG